MSQSYEVVVGNIGTVLSTNDYEDARTCASVYIGQSKEQIGRASNESVTILRVTNGDVEIYYEYVPAGTED